MASIRKELHTRAPAEAVWAAAAYGGLTWAVEMASSLGPEAPGPSQAVRV